MMVQRSVDNARPKRIGKVICLVCSVVLVVTFFGSSVCAIWFHVPGGRVSFDDGRLEIITYDAQHESASPWTVDVFGWERPVFVLYSSWGPIDTSSSENCLIFPLWTFIVWSIFCLWPAHAIAARPTVARIICSDFGRHMTGAIVLFFLWGASFFMLFPVCGALVNSISNPTAIPSEYWKYTIVKQLFAMSAMIAFVPAFVMTHKWLSIMRSVARREKGLCITCGYCMLGGSVRCPECGTGADSPSKGV